MKKPITAISEGHCRLDIPLIAWPEVQPPAYLEPKPTINPPKAKTEKPFTERMASKLKSSAGCKEAGAAIPSFERSLIVSPEICTGKSFDKNCFAMKPPMMAPIKKTRFQVWAFQLKLKNLTFLPNPSQHKAPHWRQYTPCPLTCPHAHDRPARA